MKLYTFPPAPNPTKLRVYLAEKGIEIPTESVNLVRGEQNRPEFRTVNPLGAVPVLELDDGTRLCESLAIVEYLEELHPEPAMIGRDAHDRRLHALRGPALRRVRKRGDRSRVRERPPLVASFRTRPSAQG